MAAEDRVFQGPVERTPAVYASAGRANRRWNLDSDGNIEPERPFLPQRLGPLPIWFARDRGRRW